MKALFDSCNEVFYQPKNYNNKPYLGILIHENGREYAIPLTSVKNKHKTLKIFDKGIVVIHENISTDEIMDNMVIADNLDGTFRHILSVLCIYKMIPVKSGVYLSLILIVHPMIAWKIQNTNLY